MGNVGKKACRMQKLILKTRSEGVSFMKTRKHVATILVLLLSVSSVSCIGIESIKPLSDEETSKVFDYRVLVETDLG